MPRLSEPPARQQADDTSQPDACTSFASDSLALEQRYPHHGVGSRASDNPLRTQFGLVLELKSQHHESWIHWALLGFNVLYIQPKIYFVTVGTAVVLMDDRGRRALGKVGEAKDGARIPDGDRSYDSI